ncbi:MAG: hypothetical protein GX224_07005 [Thermoplasmatales archaeon]|nr:hypothetical protein [Thermoplasmatales archaeon]
MSSYGQVIGILGGILAVAGLFLTWLSVGGTPPTEVTGWEIYEEGATLFNDYYFIPLIVLILGIVACITSVAAMGGDKSAGGINALLGLAIMALPLVYYYMTWVEPWGIDFSEAMEHIKMGAGFWLCVVGGFLVMASGAAKRDE